MPGRLSGMTGAELVAELLTERATIKQHARCTGRCQDYRDAVVAQDAVLEEMFWRQSRKVGDPVGT